MLILRALLDAADRVGEIVQFRGLLPEEQGNDQEQRVEKVAWMDHRWQRE